MLAPHQVLCGRFEVLEHLGAGGMGEVYAALDRELGDRIAIKAIRPDLLDAPGVLTRFKREVYANRRVTHPNVCRTFDLECHTDSGETGATGKPGSVFLTMELLEGETLGQRIVRLGALAPDQAQALAEQVARGLKAAHDVGILHCDLKPTNIFMTGPENSFRAVVTDFGIAKIMRSQDDATITATMIAGTPFYMAPEQFEGAPASVASDLYAYGLVLYEVLTGEKMSRYCRSAAEVASGLAKISGASGTGVNGAPAWAYVVGRCLEVKPADRFENVQQVLDLIVSGSAVQMQTGTRASAIGALPVVAGSERRPHRRVWVAAAAALALAAVASGFAAYRFRGGTAGSKVASVAVLPLTAEGDASVSAVGDAVATDLTNGLAQVSGLRVPSEMVVRSFGKQTNLKEAALQLHVDTVVAGAVTKEAEGYRLQMELVDAATGEQLWGQSYTGKQADLPALEADIAKEVAFRLRIRLQVPGNGSVQGKPVHHPSSNPAAEDAYQKGIAAMADRSPEGFDKAVNLFQQAIDADPKYASALALLSHCYALMAYNEDRAESTLALLNQAGEAAHKALQLDSTLAEAYTSLAEVEVLRDFNWGAAEEDFKRALELDPSDAAAHRAYAIHVLTPLGRFSEARAQYAYADRIAEGSLATAISKSVSDCYEGRYEASSTLAEAVRKAHPGAQIAVEILAFNDLETGHAEKTVSLLTASPAQDDDSRLRADALLGVAYVRLGRKKEAQRLWDEMGGLSAGRLSYPRAMLAASLGDSDQAMQYLGLAEANRDSEVLFAGVDPMMGPLKTDTRFRRYLATMHLQ